MEHFICWKFYEIILQHFPQAQLAMQSWKIPKGKEKWNFTFETGQYQIFWLGKSYIASKILALLQLRFLIAGCESCVMELLTVSHRERFLNIYGTSYYSQTHHKFSINPTGFTTLISISPLVGFFFLLEAWTTLDWAWDDKKSLIETRSYLFP